MDKGIVNYCKSRNFDIVDYYAHGWESGVYVMIRQRGKEIVITLNMRGYIKQAQMPVQMALNNAGFNMVSVYQEDARIVLKGYLDKTLKKAENIFTIINTAIFTASNNGAYKNNECSLCGCETDKIAIQGEYLTNICPNCMENMRISNNNNDSAFSYIKGLAGAFGGALVGAIPWAVMAYMGWFVGWLAFFIGSASFTGYKLFLGPKNRKFASFCVIFFSLFTVFLTNFLIPVAAIIIEGYELNLFMLLYIAQYVVTDGIVNIILSLGIGIVGIFGISNKIGEYVMDAEPFYVGE
ncbi:hypothetical protein LJB89_02890 [Tyzzerella sp. OttesenSCG-928-J15]|nr:hypothetical protein [Tyzzerella sp. OttesenSCG-928-J15]